MQSPVRFEFGNHTTELIPAEDRLPRVGETVICAFPRSIGPELFTLQVHEVIHRSEGDDEYPFLVPVVRLDAHSNPEVEARNQAILAKKWEG